MFCGNKEAQDASRVHRRGVILFDKVCKPVTVRSPGEIGESLWIVSMFLPGMAQENHETIDVNKTWRRSSGVAPGRQAVFTTTPCLAVLACYSRKMNYSQTPFSVIQTNCAVAYQGGGWGVKIPPPPKFWRPSKIVPNSTRLWKLLKIAEFRTPTHQDVRKKDSKILKLPRSAIVLH